MKNKLAETALVRARTQLIVGEPFYGCLALQLELVELTHPMMLGQWIDTMAVDGRHMYYWPPFVLSLTEDELKGVVAHEVSHCAYQHMTRRGSRSLIRWNIAGDYRINADLLKCSFVLPKKRLHDPKYDAMSTEEIYERLPADPPGMTVTITLSDSDGQGGNGQGNDGQGTGVDSAGCGGVIDAAAAHDKAGIDSVAHDWEVNVRMAINVARAANAGRLPGHLERLVGQLQAPKVSWREQTYEFIDQSMIKDYSWSRPNRRYISNGLVLPGFIPDALHKLVMVIDISGSISQPMMRAMVSEGAGALNQGTADQLILVYADTKVQHVDEYVQGDLVEAKVMGGGGTDFADSFRWIKQHAADASCVVYLTDMETCSFGEDPGMPTLWTAYNTQQRLSSITPPFGSIILVESPE